MRLTGWSCCCGARLDFDAHEDHDSDHDKNHGENHENCRHNNGHTAASVCGACGRGYTKQGSVVEETRHDEAAISVPLLDLKPQYATLEAEISAALRDVCSSQKFILGPRVERFEQRVADYCQSSFGIGVSSGTDALLLALMALDVGPGDEVITTPYSFFATAGTIARLGARPLFCDIDPQTYNLSADAVARLIETQCAFENGQLINTATGGAVKVLMPVHLFGLCADMDALGGLAERYGLRIIEDAAQAIGAEDASCRRAGSFGDIGCFSFFPSKNLGAFGDAGLCTTSDPALAEKMRILRTHGAEPKYHHALVGGNFRLDAIQAAVLDVKLDYLDRWTAQRQRNAAFYTGEFAQIDIDEQLSTPWQPSGCRHVFNQYTLRVHQRDELRAFLADAAIGTEVYYPVPLHQQRCFDYLGNAPDAYPEARAAAAETLALPIYPELSDVQKRHVVNSVLALLR